MVMKTHRPAPLTDAGRARLNEELHRLRHEREPRLAALLADARSQASALEEGDYLALQEDLAHVQGRIQELEQALAAERVEDTRHPAGVVAIGSRVTAQDEGGRVHTFVLVSPVEADPSRGHISAASPIGGALLGHKAGDAVSVKVPAGTRAFTIQTVE